MRRNRVSCYLPLLSLLAFLVLTLVHCSSVRDNPMALQAEDESMSAGAPGAPAGIFDEDDVLRTLPGETLNRGDVRIEARGWDSDGGQRLWVEIPDPTEYVFDFGPHGVKFSRPVRIEISLKKADPAGLPSREIRLRAGVYVTAGDAHLDPENLLSKATMALRRAQAGNGDLRIQAFDA